MEGRGIREEGTVIFDEWHVIVNGESTGVSETVGGDAVRVYRTYSSAKERSESPLFLQLLRSWHREAKCTK